MSEWSYSQEELAAYFNSPAARATPPPDGPPPPPKGGWRGFIDRKVANPRLAQALYALSFFVLAGLLAVLSLGTYLLLLADDLPTLEKLENPDLQLATIAYSVDGKEIARYARQNRSWASYDEISPHAFSALIAVEDRRFYDHWGIDIFRTVSAVGQTILGKLGFNFITQGGSTVTQQLARNLYNEEIGFDQKVSRKLKEWITAVQLEQRYTKQEILEMFLNTVEFGYNTYGIEAASRTFFNTTPAELTPVQAATLIGMLNGTTRFNPIRNPESSKRRRNRVMRDMVLMGYLQQAYYDEHHEQDIVTEYTSSSTASSFAPHFAEYLAQWMRTWGEQNGYDFYRDGLRIYTTIDSRLQELGKEAVVSQLDDLQRVVDFQWSRPVGTLYSTDTEDYANITGYEPFAHYWETKEREVNAFIRESERFRVLRKNGLSTSAAIDSLRRHTAFMDSLKTRKTRIEGGLLAIDPRNGQVKVWVGGRDLQRGWFDHVAQAKRQPGSTFKPFVYTAAIDNNYSPYYMLPDTSLTYVDAAGNVWQPGNFGGFSERMMTLREGLATSTNTISARLILEITPQQAAYYARRMGIESDLNPVPSLALGTSDVTLLELGRAYSTLANGGLRYPVTFVSRIEDRFGNVLYEAAPLPTEALSKETAYTVVDMMRAIIREGTGRRINGQFGLGRYDLAGKTGTTQESADGWFMMMHPELVMGAWVGFDDMRVQFRTDWWGQGAHNALLVVGDFFQQATSDPNLEFTLDPFPAPVGGISRPEILPAADSLNVDPDAEADDNRRPRRRVGW